MITLCAKSLLMQKIWYRDHANSVQYKHSLHTSSSAQNLSFMIAESEFNNNSTNDPGMALFTCLITYRKNFTALQESKLESKNVLKIYSVIFITCLIKARTDFVCAKVNDFLSSCSNANSVAISQQEENWLFRKQHIIPKHSLAKRKKK